MHANINLSLSLDIDHNHNNSNDGATAPPLLPQLEDNDNGNISNDSNDSWGTMRRGPDDMSHVIWPLGD